MNWQDNIAIWQANQEKLPDYLKKELTNIQTNQAQAEEAFSTDLEFGTAGMRAIMGPGSNRLNLFTVGQATEGLARLMDKLSDTEKKRGVVISYDSRFHSAEFATHCAQILGNHHIPVFLFDALRPTPELSFAIRHLKAYAGIMITASHNSKEYNGYKIYGEDGGQMPPKHVQIVVDEMAKITNLFEVETASVTELESSGLLTYIGEDVDQAYLAKLKTVSINEELNKSQGEDLKIVYTPLHGTGKMLYRQVFEMNHFKQVYVVAKQAILDPGFSTIKTPNPEFMETFDLAKKQADEVEADLIIATDPDADRLGVAVRNSQQKFEVLTGNQIAAIVTQYILESRHQLGQLEPNSEIVKSIVSSELPAKIAADYEVTCCDVLTGFKYIGEEIERLNETQSGHFLFGFEESYGYLLKDFVRDKDAMQAALILAETAAFYKDQNKTLYDAMQEIYQKYGYFVEKTCSFEFEGLDGAKKMKQLMQNLRSQLLTELNGTPIVKIEDYLNQVCHQDQNTQVFTEYPKADVLKYYLADGTWLALRPSGTEPKVKLYVGVETDSQQAADTKIENYQQAFSDLMTQ
ncbi:phospho-sugar mutase [Holzapfeliella sp. He02]|uniref:Phosphoglucomutase n=1 Tax=Holzapfeliella saturejae TaxID=3082953 RepID=A0ABU8SFR2_9LACO